MTTTTTTTKNLEKSLYLCPKKMCSSIESARRKGYVARKLEFKVDTYFCVQKQDDLEFMSRKGLMLSL